MNPIRKTWSRPSVRNVPPLMLIILLTTFNVALAATIVVDGQFGDWSGQANVTDPSGDAPDRLDIAAVYWATNADDPTAYFMFERAHGPPGQMKKLVFYRLFVDTNNNGRYDEASDRLITIDFTPAAPAAIAVFPGNGGGQLGSATGLGDGGLHVEFGIPFSALGISANQTIRFYVASYSDSGSPAPADRAPDTGDIQWAPVPALGYPLLALVVAGVVTLVIWQRRFGLGRLQT